MIGLDFLVRINALLVPFVDCVCILDARCQCLVPLRRGSGVGSWVVSAIQFAKAVSRQEDTFLAALKYDEPREKETESPLEVLKVLKTFSDVMPAKLPSKLPPKREVDHKIEQVSEAKPPARAPYRMSPLELEELRK